MPPLDPALPLSKTEQLVFGYDAHRHKILGFVLEQGLGAQPVEVQAELYIRRLAQDEGPEAAEAARQKLAKPQLKLVKSE
jgi:hypothetical protein